MEIASFKKWNEIIQQECSCFGIASLYAKAVIILSVGLLYFLFHRCLAIPHRQEVLYSSHAFFMYIPAYLRIGGGLQKMLCMNYNQEPESGINVDYLLLLVNKNGLLDIERFPIEKHFEEEKKSLSNLKETSGDNIFEIINLLETLKGKIVSPSTSYCINLSGAYKDGGVYIDIDKKIKELSNCRNLIYLNFKSFNERKEIAEKDEKEFTDTFDFEGYFNSIKKIAFNEINLWFKAFDIDIAYNKAAMVPNVLLCSNRLLGWSKARNMWKDLEYQITENLKLVLMTNFGYGPASYFFLRIIFKDIPIDSFSEWIDYRFSSFAEIKRYTISFAESYWYKSVNSDGKIENREWIEIENANWGNALEYTKRVGNWSIKNEDEFVEKFVVSECEKMVSRLDDYFSNTEFEFIDNSEEKRRNYAKNKADNSEIGDNNNKEKTRYSFSGFKLISFRAEKIIGALSFIESLIEYGKLAKVNKYIKRIIDVNRKFIPFVYKTINDEQKELDLANKNYTDFLVGHNELIKKEDSYRKERLKLGYDEFLKLYGGKIYDFEIKDYKTIPGEYQIFSEILEKSNKKKLWYINEIALHTNNLNEMRWYINKYERVMENEKIKNNLNDLFLDKTSPIEYNDKTVKILDVKEKVDTRGQIFNVVIVEGYLLSKDEVSSSIEIKKVKAGIPSNLSLDVLQELIGTEMPGKIIKQNCEPYAFVDSNGIEKVLDYKYKFETIED